MRASQRSYLSVHTHFTSSSASGRLVSAVWIFAPRGSLTTRNVLQFGWAGCIKNPLVCPCQPWKCVLSPNPHPFTSSLYPWFNLPEHVSLKFCPDVLCVLLMSTCLFLSHMSSWVPQHLGGQLSDLSLRMEVFLKLAAWGFTSRRPTQFALWRSSCPAGKCVWTGDYVHLFTRCLFNTFSRHCCRLGILLVLRGQRCMRHEGL